MKILFMSNFFNHHQSAISDALWKKTDGCFLFVDTMRIPAGRKKLGYGELERKYRLNWKQQKQQVIAAIREADVVITGSAPEKLVRERLKTGKLMFRYAERPLKNGLELWKYPVRLVRWHWRNPFWKPIYLLCASAYTAGDYAKFGMFRNCAYQWGYFPEAKRYEDVDALLAQKERNRILWCGRFLDWKHPDDALAVAKMLKTAGYAFQMDLIGCGNMEQELHALTKEWGLEDCVRFLGTMKPEQVRLHMEQAGIYLFTSDRGEGWGAVLNESMNSGCAVVASHAIGSVPYLMEDGENGLIYRSCDRDMLYEKVRFLLDHPEEQIRLGTNAYRTITERWDADTAADRLITLSSRILAGDAHPRIYDNGPCRKADIISEEWYR